MTLLSAELRGDLSEDVYHLKPGNSPDPSVILALTRLGQVEQNRRGVPVILLHGSFSNRRFWYSPKNLGLGPFLARAGFDVWIAEMRGHGLSPRNQQYSSNNVAAYARYDLPAIGAFVAEQSAQVPHWIGHSLGGVTLAAALGGKYLDENNAASVAVFGSQVSRVHWPLKVPPLAWSLGLLLKCFSYLSGSRLKRGPEDEPVGVALEILRWMRLFGRFGDDQHDWWAGLAEAQVPLLVVAADGDEQDPAWACRKLYEHCGTPSRFFLSLGKAQGFSSDFGHIEMLISKVAQSEVWPVIQHWLQEHRLPHGCGEQALTSTAPCG